MNYVLVVVAGICIIVGIVIIVRGFIYTLKRRAEAIAKLKEEKDGSTSL